MPLLSSATKGEVFEVILKTVRYSKGLFGDVNKELLIFHFHKEKHFKFDLFSSTNVAISFIPSISFFRKSILLFDT